VVLETSTHPCEELRRHVGKIANDASSKDRILLGRREPLQLRCTPDPLCDALDRNPVGDPARPTGLARSPEYLQLGTALADGVAIRNHPWRNDQQQSYDKRRDVEDPRKERRRRHGQEQ
jgi:hypothetical protein